MRTRRRLSILALLWAVVQVALPTGLTLLDAALVSGRSSSVAAPHVEDRSSEGCPPTHSSECILCRYLANATGVCPDVAPMDWPQVAAVAPLGQRVHVGGFALHELPLSRAPPGV
jgi:hypothetical protein